MAKLVNSMKKKLPKAHNSRMDQQELELLQRYLCFEAFNRAAESTGFYKNPQEAGYFQKRKETDKEEAVGEFHKFLKAHTQNEKFLQTLKMSVAVVSESDDNETRHQRQQHETLVLEWTRLTERESYSTGQSQRKRNNSRRVSIIILFVYTTVYAVRWQCAYISTLPTLSKTVGGFYTLQKSLVCARADQFQ
jgi:hypothetical protein